MKNSENSSRIGAFGGGGGGIAERGKEEEAFRSQGLERGAGCGGYSTEQQGLHQS